MSYKMFVGVFTAILSLALATGTAWANDPIVSTVKTKVSLPSQNPAAGSTQNLSLVSRGTGQASPLGANENSTHSTLYEGANWNRGSVITWSIADSPGTADSPFSGYMGSQYEALVRQAFQTWAVASGLTFAKVADTNQSDIRLGWGDFNTSSTGVVGHTSCQAQSGQFLPGVIIRLEDPAQDSLVAGTGNTLTYSGTDANLYQVILHEIGHALGLADNDDPNSVMYYEATGTNNTLARNDVAGIQTLYGSPTLATPALQAAASELSGTSMNSMIKQLSQATASFHVSISLKGSQLHQRIGSRVLTASSAGMR